MRLRTLPLSLAGVVCGGLLAQGRYVYNWWGFALAWWYADVYYTELTCPWPIW
ncbi:MAG: hypothetical protein IKR83_02690 [Bacteroidales bacterium]|nr:hypothetical protein [Bacteroidales bacterium]